VSLSDAFVIRGGLFADPDNILEALQDAFDDGDGAVLSVFLGVPAAGEERAAAVERTARSAGIRNGKIRLTTVRRLQDAGFTLVQDGSHGQPDCHYHVVFETPPDLGDAAAFEACFDEPVANPARVQKRETP
jgi:hypothetical protein